MDRPTSKSKNADGTQCLMLFAVAMPQATVAAVLVAFLGVFQKLSMILFGNDDSDPQCRLGNYLRHLGSNVFLSIAPPALPKAAGKSTMLTVRDGRDIMEFISDII